MDSTDSATEAAACGISAQPTNTTQLPMAPDNSETEADNVTPDPASKIMALTTLYTAAAVLKTPTAASTLAVMVVTIFVLLTSSITSAPSAIMLSEAIMVSQLLLTARSPAVRASTWSSYWPRTGLRSGDSICAAVPPFTPSNRSPSPSASAAPGCAMA